MNYYSVLKHIIPVFLIIALCTVLGLALSRWLLTIQYEVINIKEEFWTLWIPFGLPWIPILIWLRPRLRVLLFKSSDNGHFFFQFISAMAITACLIISQSYLTTATGKLQELSTIKDIDKVEEARYYKLKNFYVAPQAEGSFTEFRTSGKYNQTLNIEIFFVTPILDKKHEYIEINAKKHIEMKVFTIFNNKPRLWYGIKYSKDISNKISDEEKERLYKEFFDECVQKMNTYNYYDLDHFERTPNSEDKQGFQKAIEFSTKQPADESVVILEPIKERYEDRNGTKLAWIFGSFGIGLAILMIALMFPAYGEIEKHKFLQRRNPNEDDLADMLNYLIPKGDHFATSVIIDLNLLVFILMIFSGMNFISPNGHELLEWGANRRHETTSGEWWRLITSMFLHGGIMHLILNIAGLVIAAIFIEPLLGRKKFLILYILSGICASLASIWWHTDAVSVGASGAIFGLYGAILGLTFTRAFPKDEKGGVIVFIGIYVAINLLWGLTGGIDNAAHVGGLLSGAIIGTLLYHIGEKKENRYISRY